MRVSTVKVTLTEKDLLSVIKDVVEQYVKIQELYINDIFISENILIKGKYKKNIAIPFSVKVMILGVEDNKVKIKLQEVKISKIGIVSFIKNFALKKIVQKFQHIGLQVNKEYIILDLTKLCTVISLVDFKLKSIKMVPYGIETEVYDLFYTQNKQVKKNYIINEFKETKIEEPNCKPEDGYSKIRAGIEKKVPAKYDKLTEYSMIIPDIIALFWRLFKDKRVSIESKIVVGGAIAYLVSPIDILPDFIPFIGKIDDVAIAFFVFDKIINEVDEQVILDNWQGDKNIILFVKEAVAYISTVVGAANVSKLVNFIKDKMTKQGNKKVKSKTDLE